MTQQWLNILYMLHPLEIIGITDPHGTEKPWHSSEICWHSKSFSKRIRNMAFLEGFSQEFPMEPD